MQVECTCSCHGASRGHCAAQAAKASGANLTGAGLLSLTGPSSQGTTAAAEKVIPVGSWLPWPRGPCPCPVEFSMYCGNPAGEWQAMC